MKINIQILFLKFLILKARYHSFLGSFDEARNSNQKLKRQKNLT